MGKHSIKLRVDTLYFCLEVNIFLGLLFKVEGGHWSSCGSTHNCWTRFFIRQYDE